eukprot:COSAG06_NODE_226_length_19747_cov_9.234121_9_plen_72_part_00
MQSARRWQKPYCQAMDAVMAARHDADGFQLPVPCATAGSPPSAGVAPSTLRKLYAVSALHGFSDACAKLST